MNKYFINETAVSSVVVGVAGASAWGTQTP